MDITPELNNITPNYAGKKKKSLPDLSDIEPQVEAGLIYEPERALPKPLTKTECAAARRLLVESMDSLTMQLLGGAPRMSGSDEEKVASREYRRYKRTFNKLLRWLDYWEGK